MTRLGFKNTYLKTKTQEDKKSYNKERNYCVKLIEKSRREFYYNLDTESITDSKTFQKTLKPLFSDKLVQAGKITLLKSNEIWVLFPEIGRVKNFLWLTRSDSRMCFRIYIFISKKQQTNKQIKETRIKKAKETKEEKRICPENQLKK